VEKNANRGKGAPVVLLGGGGEPSPAARKLSISTVRQAFVRGSQNIFFRGAVAPREKGSSDLRPHACGL